MTWKCIVLLMTLYISVWAETDPPLIEAAKKGDIETVKALVEGGADIEEMSKMSLRFHFAHRGGGRSPHDVQWRGATSPIMRVDEIVLRQAPLACGQLRQPATPKDEIGNTALINSSARGYKEIVELLKKAGAKR
jgi:ankyrin repeat protein